MDNFNYDINTYDLNFAHKKADFKKEKQQRPSDIKVNENSVSGNSSSTASADNTNTINNRNSQNQTQGQNACLIAGECTAASSETETG